MPTLSCSLPNGTTQYRKTMLATSSAPHEEVGFPWIRVNFTAQRNAPSTEEGIDATPDAIEVGIFPSSTCQLDHCCRLRHRTNIKIRCTKNEAAIPQQIMKCLFRRCTKWSVDIWHETSHKQIYEDSATTRSLSMSNTVAPTSVRSPGASRQ